MYYPLQLPYIMDRELAKNMRYSEERMAELTDFIICFWEMQPLTDRNLSADCIIVADACIDIIVCYDEKVIGFAGMSKTDFHHTIKLPTRFWGARLMPGAFWQLSGRPASSVMDSFLPLESVYPDFPGQTFFSLPFEQSKEYLKKFLAVKMQSLIPNQFTALFHTLTCNPPSTAQELYHLLQSSPRKCQRLFAKHYGIPPKMALSIVRFQRCLQILTAPDAEPADIWTAVRYYDQPHFIRDFKRNMGITPLELIRAHHA